MLNTILHCIIFHNTLTVWELCDVVSWFKIDAALAAHCDNSAGSLLAGLASSITEVAFFPDAVSISFTCKKK